MRNCIILFCSVFFAVACSPSPFTLDEPSTDSPGDSSAIGGQTEVESDLVNSHNGIRNHIQIDVSSLDWEGAAVGEFFDGTLLVFDTDADSETVAYSDLDLGVGLYTLQFNVRASEDSSFWAIRIQQREGHITRDRWVRVSRTESNGLEEVTLPIIVSEESIPRIFIYPAYGIESPQYDASAVGTLSILSITASAQ